MSELRLLIGLPASGKSTYAKALLEQNQQYSNPKKWLRINWDDMRKETGLDLKPFKRATEDWMQALSFERSRASLTSGWNVVVDNTNLSERTRNKWANVAIQAGATYTEEKMETSLEECIRRDAEREGAAQVGRPVIERMALFAGLIEFTTFRKVIVDIDGTIADCSNRRKFIADGRHDWENFEAHTLEDEPIKPIIDLVHLFCSQGYEIIIVSGRHVDKTGKDTVKWLEKYAVPYDHIFMRAGGDNRQDFIVKQEILDRLPKKTISYILDDRNQVVDMWRQNGLTCLQVAPGAF